MSAYLFFGIIYKLLLTETDENILLGVDSFRYFTVLSNLFMNACAIMCIPFEIQGLLKHDYHLPRWVVDLVYVGVTNTTITFLFVLLLMVPRYGFVYSFVEDTSVFLHLICPILSFILFLFVNVDHEIKFSHCIFTLIPISI